MRQRVTVFSLACFTGLLVTQQAFANGGIPGSLMIQG